MLTHGHDIFVKDEVDPAASGNVHVAGFELEVACDFYDHVALQYVSALTPATVPGTWGRHRRRGGRVVRAVVAAKKMGGSIDGVKNNIRIVSKGMTNGGISGTRCATRCRSPAATSTTGHVASLRTRAQGLLCTGLS